MGTHGRRAAHIGGAIIAFLSLSLSLSSHHLHSPFVLYDDSIRFRPSVVVIAGVSMYRDEQMKTNKTYIRKI